jgi:lipoprotein Spr/probable lipoprotein NlpC
LYKEIYQTNIPNVCYKQWNVTERVKKDSLRVGDLLFFTSRESPSGWHCGTYIGNNLFVHAANRAEGVKISTLEEPKYKRRYKGAGRKR